MNNVKVILFDLWRTLIQSHCKEPVWDLQRSLRHGYTIDSGTEIFKPDDEFLRFCLTTNIEDPDGFIDAVVERFACQATDEARNAFRVILRKESGCTSRYIDVKPTLKALADQGYQLGVISNLWAFPASYIFDGDGLGKYFPAESRIYSFEVGHRKPDPEIFLHAARRFGVRPDECLMIGDNLQADVLGALDVGMKAALINREELVAKEDIPDGVPHLLQLTDILPHLDREATLNEHPLSILPHDTEHGLRSK